MSPPALPAELGRVLRCCRRLGPCPLRALRSLFSHIHSWLLESTSPFSGSPVVLCPSGPRGMAAPLLSPSPALCALIGGNGAFPSHSSILLISLSATAIKPQSCHQPLLPSPAPTPLCSFPTPKFGCSCNGALSKGLLQCWGCSAGVAMLGAAVLGAGDAEGQIIASRSTPGAGGGQLPRRAHGRAPRHWGCGVG